jgi:hypothetical protein
MIRYSFERVYVEKEPTYQVRLKGEFVTYVDRKDSALVDEILRENGYESREAFLDEAAERWSS